MNGFADANSPACAAAAPLPRRLNILLVEDSENDALLIADALRRGGFAVSWTRVDSAAELRAALARPPWQAILSDWKLPGFSAGDAFAICREAAPGVPFVIVSGFADDRSMAHAASQGMRLWVSKDRLEHLAGLLAGLGIGAGATTAGAA